MFKCAEILARFKINAATFHRHLFDALRDPRVYLAALLFVLHSAFREASQLGHILITALGECWKSYEAICQPFLNTVQVRFDLAWQVRLWL